MLVGSYVEFYENGNQALKASFKNGELKSTKVGMVPESTMKAWLRENQ